MIQFNLVFLNVPVTVQCTSLNNSLSCRPNVAARQLSVNVVLKGEDILEESALGTKKTFTNKTNLI